ncbi:MAG: orotidine-5'-phosphate decarboxylase [Rhodothermales bacterium]|jgi:orotidine-5'-phosphate decarboxylase
MKDIALDKRLIFALDVPSTSAAKALVERLEPEVRFFKVGLQLFLAAAAEREDIVGWIRNRGHEVMLDLKFLDIPATVHLAVKQVEDLGASFVTVHGYDGVMEAAADAATHSKVLAVTVLTCLDESDMVALGYNVPIPELVLRRARRAQELGCAGVVCSGFEAQSIRSEIGPELDIVMPGVRPSANRPADDQKRVVTPHDAFQFGADHIVVGRPIRNAADPAKTAAAIRAEIAEALLQPA